MIEVQFKKTRNPNFSWVIPKERFGYQLVKVTGLNPPKANVNTSRISGVDGSQFNSSSVNQRNIVLTYKPIEGNYANTVEDKRLQFIGWFEQNVEIDLCFITARRTAYISGYVESVEYDLFQNPELIQISIICPESNFHAENEETYSLVYKSGTAYDSYYALPEDKSDCDIGYILTITATANIGKMVISVDYNSDHDCSVSNISNGDTIIVNTRKGEKIVKKNGNANFNNYNGDYNPLLNDCDGSDIFYFGIRCYNSDNTQLRGNVLSGNIKIIQLYRGL